MDGISLREFARRDGCSDTLVRKGIKGGHLACLPNGNLDPALVGTHWRFGNRRPANPGANLSANCEPVRTASGANCEQPVRTDETPAEAADRIVNIEGRAPYSLAEAERIKENYLALLRQLEYDRAVGAVVAIEDVAAAVVDQFAKVRNKLLNISTRIAPRAAVLRSAEEVKALIDSEVSL